MLFYFQPFRLDPSIFESLQCRQIQNNYFQQKIADQRGIQTIIPFIRNSDKYELTCSDEKVSGYRDRRDCEGAENTWSTEYIDYLEPGSSLTGTHMLKLYL